MQDLKRILMEEIGLAVDNKGNIIDQDTMQPIKFRNKNLKNDMSKGFRHYDVVFNPENNLRQMESLLRYAANKDEIEILTYGVSPNKDGTYTCVVTTNTECLESKKYNNPSLGYVENVLKLYGTDMDLKEYDRKKDE